MTGAAMKVRTAKGLVNGSMRVLYGRAGQQGKRTNAAGGVDDARRAAIDREHVADGPGPERASVTKGPGGGGVGVRCTGGGVSEGYGNESPQALYPGCTCAE